MPEILTRRRFSRIAASALASAAALRAAPKIPIAVQLYSVRETAAKDLAGVLQSIARTGFKGVEFAGYYGHGAAEIRRMLDGNGLRAAGTHIGLESLLGDELAKTIAFSLAIGNNKLICPGFEPKYHNSLDMWKQAAVLMEEAAQKIKGDGFILGYHNHVDEFRSGTPCPLDTLLQIAPTVKLQLDIGHAARAGRKPAQIAHQYRNRIVSVHIKEFDPANDDAILGRGTIAWKDVFHELESSKGMEWYIIEEEGMHCNGNSCIDEAWGILAHQMRKG
jgi:sugar phosphate isomerase/epimerase